MSWFAAPDYWFARLVFDRGLAAAYLVAWLVPWGLYLPIVNAGQVRYGFGWESLLLETGFPRGRRCGARPPVPPSSTAAPPTAPTGARRSR